MPLAVPTPSRRSIDLHVQLDRIANGESVSFLLYQPRKPALEGVHQPYYCIPCSSEVSDRAIPVLNYELHSRIQTQSLILYIHRREFTSVGSDSGINILITHHAESQVIPKGQVGTNPMKPPG